MTTAEFLLKLAQDPELLERFRNDPEGVATEAGLDTGARQLLTSGTLVDLRIEITAQLDVDGERAAVAWLHIPWLHRDAS